MGSYIICYLSLVNSTYLKMRNGEEEFSSLLRTGVLPVWHDHWKRQKSVQANFVCLAVTLVIGRLFLSHL